MNPTKTKYLSVSIINYRLSIAERLGANKNTILQKVGISPQLLADNKSLVTLEQERTLWRAMISETNREDIGVVCGLNFPIQATGLIGYVMMNSATIGTAFHKFCRYQKLVGDSMGMRVEEDEDYFTLFIDLWSDWHEELRYTIDIFLNACLSWSEKNTIKPIRPIRVGLNYQQPSNHQVYRDTFFPAPVEFGVEKSYLIYNKKDMDLPLLSQNEEMFHFFDKQVNELYHQFEGTDTTSEKVKKIIVEHISDELLSIEAVASKMALGVRTLQKVLKTEGTSYQKLLNDIRKELAIDYLKKAVFNKSEIAFLLGFSELSVFSRNFKKWTGYSPSEYPVK